MSGDYSRTTFDSRRNFSGVLMQQGRVQLDADWNEQLAIQDRRLRAETVDIIGRAIVPKETQDGFRIELSAGQMLIHPGRMYVDGLLAENHGGAPEVFDTVLDEQQGTTPISYDAQPYLPHATALPSGGPHIAYLDVWQREVTHVKLPELVEPAVGIDTTARTQTVWQVKVLPLNATTDVSCSESNDDWDKMVQPSAGRLSTTTTDIPTLPNPCQLPPNAGYRGLENRLYRVEIHERGDLSAATFKWARHNASVETMVTEIDGTELSVVQSQWDAIRRFEVNDWVEVIDDVRELAGLSGEMRRVDDVDYATNTVVLDAALPADLAVSTAEAARRHTRIKRWDQQAGVDVSKGVISLSDGPSFHIEDGIEITFDLDASLTDGEFKTGDYWVFSARTADANVEALDRAPPRGVHHHYARLAVITFPGNVTDCRGIWPPALGHAGCCTVTVGDGLHSHGDFGTIQAAIESLPETGGRVCVLPGEYQENVLISGRDNVSVCGCGIHSRVVSPPPATEFEDAAPVVRIENSSRIRIDALEIRAHTSGIGILVEETPATAGERQPLPLMDVEMSALHVYAAFASGIECRAGSRISIRHCHVRMQDVPSEWPGIFVIGDDVLIEDNVATVEPVPGSGSADINAGRGGIQIGGTSERVRVIDNLIQQGLGDGITLGSLEAFDASDTPLDRIVAWPKGPDDPCDPCSPPSPRVPPQTVPGEEDEEPPPTYRSAGSLYDICIEHNRIFDMGRNGVGIAGFFDLNALDEFISIENLKICNNEIRRCLNKPLGEIDEAMIRLMGYGGIALGDVSNLVIHQNTIVDNGPDYLESVCGVFVLHAIGTDISHNRIVNNGAKTAASAADAKRGLRGGIHIVYAVAPTVDAGITPGVDYPRQNGVPAAKVHGNIVSQPLGRALSLSALGPVSVTANALTSRGVEQYQLPLPDSIIAATVYILNLGVSNEFYLQLLSFAAITLASQPKSTFDTRGESTDSISFARAGLDDFRIGRYLANGNVLFADNQCVLDLLDAEFGLVFSSVLIATLDDISFHNNQCDCNLFTDILWFPNYLLAPSVRANDNRFKEGARNAILSAVTFAWMNTTTGNQSTHCLLVVGPPELKIKSNNTVLADVLLPPVQGQTACTWLEGVIAQQFPALGDWL